jgi:hypothetical protein
MSIIAAAERINASEHTAVPLARKLNTSTKQKRESE